MVKSIENAAITISIIIATRWRPEKINAALGASSSIELELEDGNSFSFSFLLLFVDGSVVVMQAVLIVRN